MKFKFFTLFLTALVPMSFIGVTNADSLKPHSKDATIVSKELLLKNAAKFHVNYSAGRFDENGPLVAENIQINALNNELNGRESFVKFIKEAASPFPGQQLHDRVIILDGNIAAVNFAFQGKNTAPFGSTPPTKRNVDVFAGEIFEFNSQGLMQKLITILEFDRVEAQLQGKERISSFKTYKLLDNGKSDAAYKARIKAVAAALSTNFNLNDLNASGDLVTNNISVTVSGHTNIGRNALLNRYKALKSAFPDMKMTNEYVVADGTRAATEYVLEGTQTGPFILSDGSTLQPTRKKSRVRAMDFMAFDAQGRLTEIVTVLNTNDFKTQVQ